MMSTSTDNKSKGSTTTTRGLANLIRQYSSFTNSSVMRGLKLKERCCKTTNQVHAFTPPSSASHPSNPTISSILLSSSDDNDNDNDNTRLSSSSSSSTFGLPSSTDSIELEPHIDPFLKSVDFVHSLAQLHDNNNNNTNNNNKSMMAYLEQYSLLCTLRDPKLLRRCLQSARQHALDVHSKLVLSAWLRYERREDELVGTSSLDCIGRILECPKSALLHGYDPDSVFHHCHCTITTTTTTATTTDDTFWTLPENGNVCFSIANQMVYCDRGKIASLSRPLKTMLYGNFMESVEDIIIDFSHIGVSVDGMRAVRFFSEFRRVDLFSPTLVLEILSFANWFCCEEMKSACDTYLSLLVSSIDEALLLIDYGLEERAYLLTASCLQVILRELPAYLHDSRVINLLSTSQARQRLHTAGHSSFLLYYFLTQVSMEENMTSNLTVMLLERLRESANQTWQNVLALHQLGCVFLERREYKDAHHCFEEAAGMGHVYSVAGAARAKYKQGQRFFACDTLTSLLAKHKTIGWMYQERALYNLGNKRLLDLNEATRLDPTLSFPYKYRAVALVEENRIEAAIAEINRLIGFKVSPDSLELRAWFHIVNEDYAAAITDIRALLTLDHGYLMFNGKVRGDHLVELLGQRVNQWSPADCWMQLYDRWSCVDDIGSLAVIHHMLMNEPGKSILRFRQSLLLLRLNCHKAAMRSLRLARNCSTFKYERLVYEGWILYDTGHREEALSKAEESISIQRSFEAFFLKAYALADTYLNPESATYVVELLEEALRCPSDGLRKGQALNNLGSIFVDCGNLDKAADCYVNALKIKHTRAHQGLARVYHLKNEKQVAYDEMTKLIEKAQNKASAYEKRSEYCDRDLANEDLTMATQLDPLRTYPYRYRAAVLMDDGKENEAIEELTNAISFKPDMQMLNLRAAFYESMGDFTSSLRDCEAALCLDPEHKDTLELYSRAKAQASNPH